jgi:hypothetical protein
MSEASSEPETSPAAPKGETCAQCSKPLTVVDRVRLRDRVLCRSCYETLRREVERILAAQSVDVNYPMALVGALLGGAAGVLAWWGFTVLTKIGFGLIAVAIGFLVGLGTVHFAGRKRSAGLQALSITVAVVSFVVATYLVNMTYINHALAAQGESYRISFPPDDVELLWHVLRANLGVMDAVFLAIVVYEAWKIPRPIPLDAVE